MRKVIIYVFCLISFLLVSCENEIITANKDYLGEWRYVGTFDHRANYACYICPGFDFDKSIYRINLKKDNSITTEINYMRGEGIYDLSLRKQMESDPVFDISIKEYRELNKPVETIEDGTFRTAFLDAYWLSLYDQEEAYDQLHLQFNDNEFLLFVRKN